MYCFACFSQVLVGLVGGVSRFFREFIFYRVGHAGPQHRACRSQRSAHLFRRFDLHILDEFGWFSLESSRVVSESFYFCFAAAARLQNRLCRTPHHSELLCVIILHLLVLFGRVWCPASGVIRLIVLFSDLTLPVCRTGSAAATTTSDFFTCLFYIYWLCLALVRVLVLEFFTQLYFFFVFSPTGVLNRHCCAVHPAQHLRRFVYDFLA